MIEQPTSVYKGINYQTYTYLYATAQRVGLENYPNHQTINNVLLSAWAPQIMADIRGLAGRKVKQLRMYAMGHGSNTGTISGDVINVRVTGALVESSTGTVIAIANADIDGSYAITPTCDIMLETIYQIEPGPAAAPVLNDTIIFYEKLLVEVEYYD